MRFCVVFFVLLKCLVLCLLLIVVVFWGGGIVLFSVLLVLFLVVMFEWQVSVWLFGDFYYLVYFDWVVMDKIFLWMGLVVIVVEDQKFLEYWGFDVLVIEKVLVYNEWYDIWICGVLMLLQQMVKNLFLWDGCSWLCKGLEVGLIVGIEIVWSKKWILIVYLNIVEFGDGIFGVEVVVQCYFYKFVSQLMLGEVVLLVVVLLNLICYCVDVLLGYVCSCQVWILCQM